MNNVNAATIEQCGGAPAIASAFPPTPPINRLEYIDNLRSTMVFLVVAFHTTITYSHIGSWYYSAPGNVEVASAVAFFTFEAHCQAFFMGLLFLLAGYFVPGAYDRKGFRRFLIDRLIRLGVPSLVYIFLVQPLLQHFLLHDNDVLMDHYRRYILSGTFLTGSGPMWFALALLIFSLVYALARAFQPMSLIVRPISAPGWKALLVSALALGLVSFLVRVVQPLGTNILNMQLCFFTQYVVMFVAGIFAFRNRWFSTLPRQLGYRMLIGAAILSPPTFLMLVNSGGFRQHGLGPFLGGWQWQSAVYALWEQATGVALCCGLLVFYRERFNTKGRWSKLMKEDSFGIYFLHAPIIVAVAQAFEWLRLPPILKALIVIPIAFISVLVSVHFIARRTPLLKRIL